MLEGSGLPSHSVIEVIGTSLHAETVDTSHYLYSSAKWSLLLILSPANLSITSFICNSITLSAIYCI